MTVTAPGTPEPTPTAAPGLGPLRFVGQMLGMLRPYWLRTSLAAGATLVQLAFYLVLPLCYKMIFDEAIGRQDLGFLSSLLAGLAAGFVVVTVAELFQGYLCAGLGASVANDLRLSLFDHLQRLPMGFYARARIGDLMTRFTSDLGLIDHSVTLTLYKLVFYSLLILASTALLFVVDWRLAMITLAALPLSAIGPRAFGSRASRAGHQRKRQEALAANIVQENIQAQKVIRAFGLEGSLRQRFQEQLHALYGCCVEVNVFSTFVGKVSGLSVLLVQLVVIGVGAHLAIGGGLTGGALVGFIGLLLNVGNSARALADFVPELVQGAASKQRLDDLLAEPPEAIDPTAASELLPRLSREIRFDRVSFSYSGSERNLDEISFAIPAGRSVAFVGRSGSGKSTVLNLLARFYTTADGSITVDGRDLNRVSQESLRAQIGTVFQDTYLFNTTVRENIRQGRLDASNAEVEEAARAAEIHAFIAGLPHGYDTPVGEMGGFLSGGQRQRLALARAILRHPTILVLDEATSALDPATEAAVNATLEKLARSCTLIAVTHRLSATVNMDRIFVLDQGKLVEQGTHKELLNRKGVYFGMWQDYTLELTQHAIIGEDKVAERQTGPELPEVGELDHLARRVRELETEVSGHLQEVQRLQAVNQRWAQLAGTDRLTGLPNKVAFLQALLPQQLQQAQRGGDPVGLILLSGDELGKINETRGRDAGDEVLRGLAELLRSILKGEELLGHIDGTHFAVALYPASLAAVRERAEEVRQQVEAQALPCAGSVARITVSAGVMSIPSTGGEEPRALAEASFDRLNGALYAAKRAGGNRVESLD